MFRVRSVFVLAFTLLAVACGSSPTAPGGSVDFVVDVVGERFVLRLTDPQQIQAAEDNRLGRNSKFPLGPLRAGNGGFNAPWSWHFDPAQTTLVEVAIEVCDGRPSYVEEHRQDFATYCPWGARVVGRK